jgi:hypothetical protein
MATAKSLDDKDWLHIILHALFRPCNTYGVQKLPVLFHSYRPLSVAGSLKRRDLFVSFCRSRPIPLTLRLIGGAISGSLSLLLPAWCFEDDGVKKYAKIRDRQNKALGV